MRLKVTSIGVILSCQDGALLTVKYFFDVRCTFASRFSDAL